MKRTIPLKRLWLTLFWIAASTAYGQAPDSDDDDVYELSPFTVSAPEDEGYYATSTLAGTRIRTDLRDLAASISVVTEEFLEDTASIDLEDVLVYTGNTEVGGLGGNFSGSQGFGAGLVIPELQRDTNSGGVTRIRGLAEADLTRDYYITDIPFDTYNTDRVTVQRGANAVLFGLGSPGGVVNNNLLKAQMRDYGMVRYRTDEHGTQRGMFRLNDMLIDDKLAVVVAGLAEDEKFEQKEAYSRNRRAYGNLLFQPVESLRFRASVELGDIDSAKPRFTPPNDAITPWFDFGKPTFDTPQEAGEFRRATGGLVDGVRNNQIVIPFGPGRHGPLTIYADPTVPEPSAIGGQTFVNLNQDTPSGHDRSMLSFRTINDIIRRTGQYPDGTPVPEGSRGFFGTGFADQQITDRSIFDYREHLLDGGNSTQFSDFRDVIVSVEKTWLEGDAGVELAYKTERFEEGQLNQLRGGASSAALSVDMNRFIGTGTVDGSPDGEPIPNPNFGGIAILSQGQNGLSETERDSYRATGFYNFDFEDAMGEGFLSDLLGRTNFTGVLQKREIFFTQFFSEDTADASPLASALGGGDIGSLPSNVIDAVQYHALPIGNGTNLLNISDKSGLSGLDIQPIPFGNEREQIPDSGTFLMWDKFSQRYVEVSTGLNTALDGSGVPAAFFGSKSETEIESQVAVLQWHAWNDNLVLNGSWRKDDQDVFSAGGAPSLDGFPRRSNLLDPEWVVPANPTDRATGQIRTWSAVLHTPEFIRENMPWGLDLSFHAGEGENFEPTAGRRDVFGDSIAPVTGETEEYGFTVSTAENKFIARFNWYETGSVLNSFDNGSFSAPEGIMIQLAEQLDNPDNVAQGFDASDAQAVLPQQSIIDLHGVQFDFANAMATSNPDPSRTGTQDFVSEGMEIEVNYTPIRGWSNLLVVAQQETVTSNTAPKMRRWIEDFVRPQWVESSFAQNYFINDESSETLAERAARSIVNQNIRDVAQDGTPSIEQREWRINLTSKYRFSGNENFLPGWSEGLTVGGSVRWEDEAGTGFGVTTNDFGEFVIDVNQPFFADSQTFLDLFFSYRFNLKNDVNTLLQLNISDLTNHDDLVPIYTNPDGSNVYRLNEGRVVSLSATLNF